MATLETTAPAPFALDIQTVEDRIQNLQSAERGIRSDIAVQRNILTQLLEKRDSVVSRLARAENPYSLSNLLDDPSYDDDGTFQPSAEDLERKTAFEARQTVVNIAATVLKDVTDVISTQKEIRRNVPYTVKGLRREVDYVNASVIRRFVNVFSGQRETAERTIADLKEQLSESTQRLAEAEPRLAPAQEKLAKANPNKPYDLSLHTIEKARPVRRTEQSVLLTFSKGSGNEHLFTLAMPTRPGEQDFTTTLKLDLRESDAQEFASVVGNNLPVETSYYDTVELALEFGDTINAQLVPFPLEVVTDANGEERYRLPDSVWKRFGSDIVNG